jgi:Domain of unknown function (DUF4032)
MIFNRLDYTIEKAFEQKPTLEQKFILQFTGKRFPAVEARNLWLKVIDHKWYISEKLDRDVGLRVAAVDYLHNIYEPQRSIAPKNNFKTTLSRIFRRFSNSVSQPHSNKLSGLSM